MHVDVIIASYIICMSIGIMLSLFALILGGPHGHFNYISDGDLGGGHHGLSHSTGGHHLSTHSTNGHSAIQENASVMSVPLFNINALFAFFIGFGAAGLIAYSMLKSTILSLIPAIACGLLFWHLVRLVLGKMIRGQTKFMTSKLDDSIGCTGIVVSKIFSGAIGEVMYILEGANKIIRAKSKTFESIEKGENVVIIGIDEGIATVIKGGSIE